MASKVSIWNIALSNIGNKAAIVDPDETSAEANHCRRFYPIALDAILEKHAWSFATRRESLAEVDNPVHHWAYAYALPNLCVTTRAILLPNSTDDTQEQDYAIESDGDGNNILYTNVQDAVIKYTASVEDTTKFTPNFVLALAAGLSALLVGPIPKDPKMRQAMQQMSVYYLGLASAADANSSKRSSQYRDFIPGHMQR